jgi:hypothetical protein
MLLIQEKGTRWICIYIYIFLILSLPECRIVNPGSGHLMIVRLMADHSNLRDPFLAAIHFFITVLEVISGTLLRCCKDNKVRDCSQSVAMLTQKFFPKFLTSEISPYIDNLSFAVPLLTLSIRMSICCSALVH